MWPHVQPAVRTVWVIYNISSHTKILHEGANARLYGAKQKETSLLCIIQTSFPSILNICKLLQH